MTMCFYLRAHVATLSKTAIAHMLPLHLSPYLSILPHSLFNRLGMFPIIDFLSVTLYNIPFYVSVIPYHNIRSIINTARPWSISIHGYAIRPPLQISAIFNTWYVWYAYLMHASKWHCTSKNPGWRHTLELHWPCYHPRLRLAYTTVYIMCSLPELILAGCYISDTWWWIQNVVC